MIETPKSVSVINGVDLGGATAVQPTHIFYIRYRSDVTNETFISYASKYYDILRFTNLDEQNKFLKLEAVLSGSTSSAASKVNAVT
jgi:head-tail adaptor